MLMKIKSKIKNLFAEEKGAAMIIVMGIIVILFVLMTGMFSFSTNDRLMAIKSKDHKQAKYLAESALEACSKDFGKKIKEFKSNPDNQIEIGKDKPITSTIYLYEEETADPTDSSKTIKTAKFSSTAPTAGTGIGYATVTIKYVEDEKYNRTGAAYEFESVAKVNDATYTSKAHLPCNTIGGGGAGGEDSEAGGTVPDESEFEDPPKNVDGGKGWIDSKGAITVPKEYTEHNGKGQYRNIYNKDSTYGSYLYDYCGNYEDAKQIMEWTRNGSNIKQSNDRMVAGKDAGNKNIKINENLNIKNNVEKGSDGATIGDITFIHMWSANNFLFKGIVDLRGLKAPNDSVANIFALKANNCIFDKIVYIEAQNKNNNERVSDIVLVPKEKGKVSHVVFKEGVQITFNKRDGKTRVIELIPAGKYSFSDEVSLIQVALASGKIDEAKGWITSRIYNVGNSVLTPEEYTPTPDSSKPVGDGAPLNSEVTYDKP